MNIYDLDVLVKTGDEFDLNQRTFNWAINVPFNTYIVDRTEEMRIDLVCRTIYGNVNYCGFLMYFNNIDNPLNIKAGDAIRYTDALIIDNFKISADTRTQIEFLQNLNRGTQVDPNRTTYLSRATNPTFNTEPIEQVVDRNGTIIIGNRE
jgi:hypothetical protein